ncbi:MAG: hypothetical protein UR98_C0018G0012 [Parcubacteria group bacterium GW2011_GWA1_36_12]|nr:MAG: hypothetical protein UR98_C0018G0012 [Parcubacteria group bacterium GW2011_GWA1_36_12]
MRGILSIVFIVILTFFVFSVPVLAESGCGGTDFCQGTIIENYFSCSPDDEDQICIFNNEGSFTTDCTVTADTCETKGHDYSCGSYPGCSLNVKSKTKSCCSGAGGGGQDCPSGEYELVKKCKPTDQCPADRTGAKCGQGRKWCFSLVCVGCSATAPSNLSFTPIPPGSSATVSWTDGTGGTSNRLYVGDDKTKVEADCPQGFGAGTGCVYSSDSATSPTVVSGLSLGTVYYARLVNYKDEACSAASGTLIDVSSCYLSPDSATLSPFESQAFTTSVNYSTEIDRVAYDVSNPPTTEVDPASDTNGQDGYHAEVTALSLGSSVLTSDVIIDGEVVCTDTADINVTAPGPWWQVMDSDIQSMGDIASDVASGNFFGLAGAGGYPGVIAYTGSASFGSGEVSDPPWLVDSLSQNTRRYDYAFFENQIPSGVIPKEAVSDTDLATPGTDFNGYELFKHTGPIDFNITSPVDFAGRKVILFIENSDLFIGGNINLNDGVGFFGVFVDGSITIVPTVTSLEGIYLSDSSFSTGLGNTQLSVRGSVAAYEGVNLQRDIDDDSEPSEFFEYAPDQILLFPSKLGTRKMDWKEVAP